MSDDLKTKVQELIGCQALAGEAICTEERARKAHGTASDPHRHAERFVRKVNRTRGRAVLAVEEVEQFEGEWIGERGRSSEIRPRCLDKVPQG